MPPVSKQQSEKETFGFQLQDRVQIIGRHFQFRRRMRRLFQPSL
jgi:hypothetical protein